MTPIEKAEAAYDKARADVIDIQTQLAQRKPIGRVTDAEYADYREWSGRAKGALRHRLAELVRTKAEAKKLRGVRTSSVGVMGNDLALSDLQSPAGLIRASFVTLKRMAIELEGDIDPEEQSVIDALQAWLDKEGL